MVNVVALNQEARAAFGNHHGLAVLVENNGTVFIQLGTMRSICA